MFAGDLLHNPYLEQMRRTGVMAEAYKLESPRHTAFMRTAGRVVATAILLGLIGCSSFMSTSGATIPTPTPSDIMIKYFTVPKGIVVVEAGAGSMGFEIINGEPDTATLVYSQGNQIWGEVAIQCKGTNSAHTPGTSLSFGQVSNFATVDSVQNGNTTYNFESKPSGSVNSGNIWRGPQVCENLQGLPSSPNN